MKNGTLLLNSNNQSSSSRNFNSLYKNTMRSINEIFKIQKLSGFKTTASMPRLAKLNDYSYFGSEQALIISSLKQTPRIETYYSEDHPMQIQ